ncbi:BA14K family protein [Cohaesibacter celericrescens]|uniref:BA14K family protein n=1 Tax=Cohaesibacter celericrescens TaxID=2067669 RepID=UPI0035674121
MRMNAFYKSLCVGTLTVSMCASAFMPAMALPSTVPLIENGQASVTQIDYRKDRKQSRDSTRLVRRNGYYYYNGHRGYSKRRAGYRQYNGYWFPPAAFLGAIIKGVTKGSRASTPHVAWCRSHYKSYRVSDDTYQPYHGPRKRCVSR